MDAKLLSPTLSVVLVKTIKALCEINIKYDNKLEITGSLHVRSDGQKVLTCLLDEETVKGQYDAARVAELAARLSMAAASFPFPHLQMSANVNHSQQVAEALFSSIQGDVHILSAQQQLPVTLERPTRDESEMINNAVAQMAAFHHAGKLPDVGGGGQGAALQDAGVVDAMLRQQEETRQAIASLRQHEEARQAVAALKQSDDMRARPNEQQQPTIQLPAAHHPNRKQRHSDTASKALGMTKAGPAAVTGANAITGYAPIVAPDSGLALFTPTPSGNGGQNHVKLPDIQTLAHSLPKIPGGSRIKTTNIANSGLQPVMMPIVTKSETIPSFSSPPTDPVTAISPVTMPSLDPMMNISLEVQTEMGLDGTPGSVHKKKFQCMFCGIFLSTKCYLKNHINAMHTRARVYPCELCERYFYSAGALRIHKLRNHWQDSKKHICVHCGETFLLPIELRKHIVKKHVGNDDHQLLMDTVELKLEDSEISMPQLQPEDVSIQGRGSLAPTPTSVCYQTVGEVNHPTTPNSTHTPSSLDGSGGMIE